MTISFIASVRFIHGYINRTISMHQKIAAPRAYTTRLMQDLSAVSSFRQRRPKRLHALQKAPLTLRKSQSGQTGRQAVWMIFLKETRTRMVPPQVITS